MQTLRQWRATAWLAGPGAQADSPLFLFDYLLRALRVAVLIALWKIVFGARPEASPIALDAVLGYVLLAEVFAEQLNLRTTISEALWQGSIVKHFLRPMPLVSQFAAEMLGGWLLNFALFSIPLLFAASYFDIDVRPASALALVLFASSLGLAICVGLAIDFIATAVTMASNQPVWLVQWVRNAVVVVFSGAVFPLVLLPWNLGAVFEWLPFASVAWAPLAIYTGIGSAPKLIALQIGWALALGLFASRLWNSNREKLVGYGG